MTEGLQPRRTNAVPIAEEISDEENDAAPPAYGEFPDQLQLSQDGFSADAAVTSAGRINIHISEKNNRLSRLLAPSINKQLQTSAAPAEPLPPPYIPASLGGQPGQTPPPRLNVVIQIVGSRGDVQPFVALGQVLRDTYGHRVRIATHGTFKGFVEENGLEFFSIGGDPAELMAFMVKHPGLMPGFDAIKSGEIKKRRQGIEEILKGCWRSCVEGGDGSGVPFPTSRRNDNSVVPGDPSIRPFVADVIIANPPSFAHIHIAEKLGIPLHMMFTMPWTPTRAFPHPLADIVATNADDTTTNYASYALVEMMTWQGLGDVINRFRTGVLDLDPLSLLWAPGLLNRLRIPTTYCWSPALIPKPADWNSEISISGFFFLNLSSSYTPDPALAAFLAAGPPPVYIGFGSIVVDDPDALTRTIFDAVASIGVRALVSKGWGGIGGEAIGLPENVFMLGNCPHDWLFKQVSAVVHHGGAGTTAAGINAGKPTVVVPFFGDQIFWGSMIARAGAGPAPIPYKTLNAENLAAAITECLKSETQARALELGQKIREEQGCDVGGKSFHQFLNTDNLRCSLAPSRVAIWRVRRTQVRLSALAGAVLVKEGWLKYSDLKLYRSVEHNTEEQPWDPITAASAALIGDFGALSMAIADFPREMFKGKKAVKPNAGGDDGASSTADDASSVPSGYLSPSTTSLPHQRPGTSRSDASSPTSFSKTATQSPLDTSISSLSAGRPHSPQQGRTSPAGPSSSRTPLNRENSATPSTAATQMDLAVGAGQGAMRILSAGAKFHTNFCLGLARGFRNAPKLYNDDTVRPAEKVTGISSGLKLAGKEFGFGLYDGVSGLVTQPMKGAEKEGAAGFIKGFGKGIGGLVLKPAAGFWGIPAYAFQGIQEEVRRAVFGKGEGNYIMASRVKQAEEDIEFSTEEEKRDILARWMEKRDDLKGFYSLKQKEKEKTEEVLAAVATTQQQQRQQSGNGKSAAATVGPSSSSSPQTGWFHTRKLSFETRKKLQKQKEEWKKKQSGTGPPPLPPRATSSGSSSSLSDGLEDDEALETAIQDSIRQTSQGNPEEDVEIEAAVRASVKEMRKAAAAERKRLGQQQQLAQTTGVTTATAAASNWPRDAKTPAGVGYGNDGHAVTDEELRDVTDEEYQALIEEAVRQSLLQQQQEYQHYHQHQPPQYSIDEKGGSNSHNSMADEKSRLRERDRERSPSVGVVELYGDVPAAGRTREEDGDDEEFRRVMEESERAYKVQSKQMEQQRTEEDIVLEYVKKQSLAEEEHRRKAGKGKGVAAAAASGEGARDEDDDEDLKRALEESLKMSSGGGGGAGWDEHGGRS